MRYEKKEHDNAHPFTSYAGITRIRFKGPEAALYLCISAGNGSQRPCVGVFCGLSYCILESESCQDRERGTALRSRSGCQKSPRTFPTACKNAVTFPPRSGGKVLAALAERLAVQGIRGIRSHSRRAAAPSSSPAKTDASSTQQRFFDKLLSSASVSRAASAAYRVMTSINVIMVELSSMVPIFSSFHSSRSW